MIHAVVQGVCLFSQHTLLLEKDEMLQRLQKENLQLDSISGKDELTGILNRPASTKKPMPLSSLPLKQVSPWYLPMLTLTT